MANLPSGRTTEPRTVTITKTSGQAAVSAPAGTFAEGDVGSTITGAGIPAGSTIEAVDSDTAATLSTNATATAVGSADIGGGDPTSFGFRGWSPESDAEAAAYTVAAVNAGVVPPEHMTSSTVAVTQRSRS